MMVLCMFYIKHWERCKDSLMVIVALSEVLAQIILNKGNGYSGFPGSSWPCLPLISSPWPTCQEIENTLCWDTPCTLTAGWQNDLRLTGIIRQELFTPLIISSNQSGPWRKLCIAGRFLLDTEAHNIHNGKKGETNAKVHRMAWWLLKFPLLL